MHMATVAEQEQEDHVSANRWLLMFLTGLPLEVHNPVRRFPWAVTGLIAVNVLVYVVELLVTPQSVLRFSFVPSEFRRLIGVHHIVSAMFMHANLIHLLGNLYFLYTFGDNVEDFLGPLGFLALYFVGGILAHLTYFVSNIYSTAHMVGASGAISAVFAAYMLLYPRRRIYFLVIIWPMKVRAVWYGLGWIALQIFLSLASTAHIAWWDHIGGFAAGLVLIGSYLKYKHLQSPAGPV